ncbi:hypothetical protein LOK49_LG13G02133 [Camellia lanceoleosa]|uniref:Uncharacterized protein n=1 Tax=Camellia lanceoleosa TaxID=1840588 RepID=A0ACC0FKY8_9ERIC|nr:hypothetical protein LOK49_LG13G02133 [Camellia lanceoleosa]
MAGSVVARNSNLKRLEVGDGVEGSNSRKEKEKEQKMANSKQHPLLQMIYATVIVGIILSSFYVFSAVYSSSPHSTTTSPSTFTSTWWLLDFLFVCLSLSLFTVSIHTDVILGVIWFWLL